MAMEQGTPGKSPALGLKVIYLQRASAVPLCFDRGQAVTFLDNDLHAWWEEGGLEGGALLSRASHRIVPKIATEAMSLRS